MNIKPLFDYIAIKRDPEEKETESGIILPGKSAEKPGVGEVIAAGIGKFMPDETWRPLKTQVGNRVLFGRYAGQEVIVNKEEIILIKEEDILAILE